MPIRVLPENKDGFFTRPCGTDWTKRLHMKTPTQLLIATLTAAALFASHSLQADPAAATSSQTVTSSGSSVGTPTNETPKPDAHSQSNGNDSPVAQGSNPTTSSNAANGQTSKPDGHGQASSTGSSTANPQGK